jgi:hypothetical protein
MHASNAKLFGLAAVIATMLAGPAYAQRTVPGPRVGHSLIFDVNAKRVLLFDGYLSARARPAPGSQPDSSEIWAWNGNVWQALADSGPRPLARTGNGVVYDVGRHRVVSFGGTTIPGNARDDDTWEWDGRLWWHVADSGACARDHQMMAYDDARAKTILFGGACRTQGPAPPTDTWAWSGAGWTRVASDGPSARISTMMYDGARQQIVLFGGIGLPLIPGETQPLFDDTWTWNGAGWRRADVNGPPARTAHAMAFDAGAGVLLLHGGIGRADQFGDFWKWNGQGWTELKPGGPTPGPRQNHAMVYDPVRRKTVLFGGSACQSGTCQILSDTWEWDGRVWTRIN